ncbi:MAG: hypothetical protein ACAF41_15065 [Leptolyngbya sp. BL-A-14]
MNQAVMKTRQSMGLASFCRGLGRGAGVKPSSACDLVPQQLGDRHHNKDKRRSHL